MRGFDGDESAAASSSHRSADDLDDGFVLDADDKKRKKVGFTLAYKDGKAIVDDEEEEEKNDQNKMDEDEGENEGDDEEAESDDDDDDEDDDQVEGYSDMEDESEDESDDNDEEEVEQDTPKFLSTSKKGILKQRKDPNAVASAVAARKEIPYTFTMPTTLGELEEVLRPFNEKEQVQK